MRKIMILLISLIICAGNALAYTIDGDLSDWGVDLISAFSGSDSAWHPAQSSVDFSIEDNIHPDNTGCDWTGYCARGYHTQTEPKTNGYLEPAGGEASDIEALYFDDDSSKAYFAIVISMPDSGYTDPWGRHYDPGDLAIDLDNDGTTGEHGYEYGIKTTGADKGQVCFMPEWSLPQSGIGLPDNAPSTMSCSRDDSVVMGTADVSYVDTGISDNGFSNYVIEVSVDRTFIGNPRASELSELHTTLTCGNDLVEINDFEWDYDVPEFSTIGAVLVLAAAVIYIKRRRK
ncbi:hypothetical protein GF327_00570 [Candidatus Woesearchaeota archaeon]|nr:hypothetical protein [Candidatus Woesearchaeota archaeon]